MAGELSSCGGQVHGLSSTCGHWSLITWGHMVGAVARRNLELCCGRSRPAACSEVVGRGNSLRHKSKVCSILTDPEADHTLAHGQSAVECHGYELTGAGGAHVPGWFVLPPPRFYASSLHLTCWSFVIQCPLFLRFTHTIWASLPGYVPDGSPACCRVACHAAYSHHVFRSVFVLSYCRVCTRPGLLL